MKISELMMTRVTCCGPQANLAEAAEILWRHDCGVVPVVDEKKRIVGILTDRDICIALGTREKRASDVAVEDVMSKNVFTCSPDDDVKSALAIMHTRMVRRLPVVGPDKTVRGILSLSAVVRHASPSGELSYAAVMNVLKRLSERRVDHPARTASTAQPIPCSTKVSPDPVLVR